MTALVKHLGVNIRGLHYFRHYTDYHFDEEYPYFDDFVIGIPDKFINICRMTPQNQSRYRVLVNINERLSPNLFIKSECFVFNYGGHDWFYECMDANTKNYMTDHVMSIHDTERLINTIADINADVATITKSMLEYPDHNEFFKRYVNQHMVEQYFSGTDQWQEFENNMASSTPYITFGDIEKTFEQSRLWLASDCCRVGGLQALVPRPPLYGQINALIFSSLMDTDRSTVLQKMKLVESDLVRPVMLAIIDNNLAFWSANPSFCFVDVNKTLPKLQQLKEFIL